jgi:hypothetical protein
MNLPDNLFSQSLDDMSDDYYENITCDKKKCMKNPKLKGLYNNYLHARTTMLSAPSNLKKTVKKYYMYSEGSSEYNNHIEAHLKHNSTEIVNAIKQNFNDNIRAAKNALNSYKGTFVNSQSIMELYDMYFKENDDLNKRFDNTKSDILTNQRRSYYNDQGTEKNTSYSKILTYIYVVLIIGVLICIFTVKTSIPLSYQLSILLFILLFPIMFSFLILKIIHAIYKTNQTLK